MVPHCAPVPPDDPPDDEENNGPASAGAAVRHLPDAQVDPVGQSDAYWHSEEQPLDANATAAANAAQEPQPKTRMCVSAPIKLIGKRCADVEVLSILKARLFPHTLKGHATVNTLTNRSNTQALVERLLDAPHAVDAVRALPARVLGEMVTTLGLEDAGHLVALASVEQLVSILDADVWRARQPGQAEVFDAARFGTWLEVLVEMGANAAAQRLLELDEDFVAHAFQALVLVVDMDALALEMSTRHNNDDDEQLDKALDGMAALEVDHYRLMSRTGEAFDALCNVVTSMDERDHSALMRLLERCAAATQRDVEADGLHQVLTAAQQLQSDAEAAREDRREREGYVDPRSAAAFLALARSAVVGQDPITRSYFSHLPKRRTGVVTPSPLPGVDNTALAVAAERPALRAFLERSTDAAHHVRELTYLANVLVAGASAQGRALREVDAVAFALDTCNLGLELQPEGAPLLVTVFGWGLQALHALTVTSAEAALRVLVAHKVPGKTLELAIKRGKPWQAGLWRALVPGREWPVLLGLMDECPRWRGAFVQRTTQLEEARAYLGALRR